MCLWFNLVFLRFSESHKNNSTTIFSTVGKKRVVSSSETPKSSSCAVLWQTGIWNANVS